VAGYHVVNVCLHALSALFIVALVRLLRLPGPWLAAFLFGLHPVCVESVAWIAEQKNTLSTALALASTIVYFVFLRERRAAQYALASGLFILAVLSKSIVVTLPLILVIIQWWQSRRLSFVRDLAPLLPWMIAGITVSFVTVTVERGLIGFTGSNTGLTFAGRIVLAGRAFWFYISKIIWPSNQMFFYPRWEIHSGEYWQDIYPAATVALGFGLMSLYRSARGPLAAYLCFITVLLPVLGFLDVEWFVFSYVGDHLAYLAVICLVIPAPWVLERMLELVWDDRRFMVAPLAGILTLALGILSWRQCEKYRSPIIFYEAALRSNPSSGYARNHLAIAHYNLACDLQVERGRLAEAIAQYEEALRIRPDYPEAHNNLGTAQQQTGAIDSAIAQFRNAIRDNPDYAGARLNLAAALQKTPNGAVEALEELRMAARIQPGSAQVHLALAKALQPYREKDNESIEEYRLALRIDPNLPEAHYGLGYALERIGGHEQQALNEYGEAVRLRPSFSAAHYNRGCVLQSMPGRQTEAAEEFEITLRLDPNNAMAQANLANALLALGRPQEAIAHYQAAEAIAPDNPLIHLNLGIILSALPEKRDDAIRELNEAHRLQPNDRHILEVLEHFKQVSR
jgi:tetratricopeptide (TPR) repeat protein